MPINYSEYHPKWKLISKLIRYKRAQNRCEKCDVLNGSIIKRLDGDKYRHPSTKEWDMIHSKIKHSGYSMSGALKKLGFTRIILTVAHIDHDKTNNRFSNLAAWCQRCHLKHDAHQHVDNRKYGRKWKQNQLNMFE